MALVILVAMSAFYFMTNLTNAGNNPTISAVLSGTTDVNIIPAQAIGTTFSVDIRVDNIAGVSPGVDAASYNVTWDPTVLSCTAQQDNKWLPDQFDTDIPANNTIGLVGIGQVAFDTSNASVCTTTSGVSTTLTFQVLSSGNCTIGIEQSSPIVPLLQSPNGDVVAGAAVAGVVVQNATYGISASLLPHGPIASFTPTDGSYFQVGTLIALNATSSQPGYDGTQACPITSYAWLVQYFNGTQFTTLSGVTANFTASALGAFNVILIVTAPSSNPPSNPNFSTTNSTTATIQIVTTLQPTTIQVYTDQGGIGGQTGTYGPLQLVQMYALVKNQNVPVVGQSVVFNVENPNSTLIDVIGNVTDSTGTATASFRLPNLDLTAPQISFGTWTITASINSLSPAVSNSTSFMFSYQSGIENVTVPASISTSETLPIQLTINNQYLSQQWTELSISIFDQAGIPIGSAMISTPQQVQNVMVVDTTIIIPSWAFPGQATIYFCLLTNSTSTQYVPIAPETEATFNILP